MADYVKVGLNQYDYIYKVHMDQVETQYDCGKTEQRAGNWTMLGDLKPNADVGVSVGTSAKRFLEVHTKRVREDQHHIKDDFIGSALHTKRWTATLGAGASAAGLTDADGGVLAIATGSTINTTARIDFNALRSFRHAKNAIFEAYVNIAALTQVEVEIGWYKDATHYCNFQLDAAASNVNIYCKSHDGSSANSVDSGTTHTDAARWYLLTISCVSGHIYFYIDGTQVADMTTNIPTDYWEPRLYVKCTDAANKVLNVDRVELEGDY
jgi:hypothetical protein